MLYKKVNGWKNISPEKAEQVFTMGEEYKKAGSLMQDLRKCFFQGTEFIM